MSKNFELLRRAGKEQELFQTPDGPTLPLNDNALEPSRTNEPPLQEREEGDLSGSPPLIRPLDAFKASSKGPGREGEGPAQNNRRGLDLEEMTRQEEIKLVQRVFLLPSSGARRAVLFSGVEQGDGCGRVCARTGETLAAQLKASVCVVDANLHSPSLHKYFGVDNLRGLSEAVLQSGSIRDFAQKLTGSNLWLIPCGSVTSDPHPLLTSDRLRSRIAELRADFDHVLINVAPVNLYADSIPLAQWADGVVLVVEANYSKRETARRTKESLEAANVRLLGAVLDNRTFPIPEALYGKL